MAEPRLEDIESIIAADYLSPSELKEIVGEMSSLVSEVQEFSKPLKTCDTCGQKAFLHHMCIECEHGICEPCFDELIVKRQLKDCFWWSCKRYGTGSSYWEPFRTTTAPEQFRYEYETPPLEVLWEETRAIREFREWNNIFSVRAGSGIHPRMYVAADATAAAGDVVVGYYG
jgi:hypothetical protein